MIFALVVGLALTAPESSSGRVEIVSELAAVRAGQPFTVGIRLIPASGWHTYWINPGDSGSPTVVSWHLPKGWSASPTRYPVPTRIVTTSGICYGYEGDATLLATIRPPENLAGKSVEIQGKVEWLTCTPQICQPAKGDFNLTLPITMGPPTLTQWHVQLAEDASKLAEPLVGATASASRQGHNVVLSLAGSGVALERAGKPYFFADTPETVSNSKEQAFLFGDGTLTATLPISEYAPKPPTRLSGVLKAPPKDPFFGGYKAIYIDVPITGPQEKKHA